MVVAGEVPVPSRLIPALALHVPAVNQMLRELRERFTIETEREDDGRWIVEIVELPGGDGYGATRAETVVRVEALALRVVAERY